MMINCPKCNLLQPKDQYCAQCGVNMETYKPPQAPIWKKLLGNWMVQLGLLFVIILVVVMWDSIRSNNTGSTEADLPPVSSRIQRDESFAPEPEESIEDVSGQRIETQQKKLKALETQNNLSADNKKADPIATLQKRLSMKMMTIVPSAVESISQLGRTVDDGSYVVKRQSQWLSKNRKGIKGFGTAVRKSYEFDQPAELFFGEDDQETGTKIGFFAQVTVSENSTVDAINAEVRFWHQLKLDGSPSSPIVVDVVVQKQDGVIILDPGIHDIQFSPEETSLFDASNRLSGLNDELFVESLSDMAVLIEFK